jgi:hypothetical protein
VNARLRASLVATLFVCATPLFAHAQGAAVERLQARVDSLELRIIELERRVSQLENAATSEPDRRRPVAGNARDIANWRRLRERMTYDQVRTLLGEPEKIDGGTVAFWSYPDAGQVTFISGRVTSWSEPSR